MYELKLLFATNFSDSCFRAIRAIAQMADSFRIGVTIAHTTNTSRRPHRELHSFFAEADHYAACRRVLLEGPPAQALAKYTREERFDLIIAPGSDRIGIPRPFHQSIRSALLRNGTAPIWTTSRGLEAADFRRPIRTIAVGIDGWDSDLRHLSLAAAYAGRIDAQLRLLTVIPPVTEGTLAAQAIAPEPLHPDAAIARIENLLKGWHHRPVVEVAIGSATRELPRMAARLDADLLFLTEAQSCGGLFSRQMNRTVNHAPCAVVCVPSTLPPRFGWSFQTERLSEACAVLG